MGIRNFSHKGLKRLYEDDDARGIPPAAANKLRDMLFALDRLRDIQQIYTLTSWKPHGLSGNRKGEWSLFVTRNWRLTFRIDTDDPIVCDVNLEDYH